MSIILVLVIGSMLVNLVSLVVYAAFDELRWIEAINLVFLTIMFILIFLAL